MYKILIVHNRYQIPGGEDAVVKNEMQLLQENGCKVILYTRDNKEISKMSLLRKLLLPFSFIFSFKTYKDIKGIIEKEGIELVHVHNVLNLISPAVYYAALNKRVPIIKTIHNFRLLCPGATFSRNGIVCEDCVDKSLACAVKYKCYRSNRLQTLACVVSTKIHRSLGVYGKIKYICLTEFNKNMLLKLKQVQDDQVYVKPNFVKCTNRIIPYSERNNCFIYAGRLDKLKGIDIMLAAWKKLGKEAPDLLVCGIGPMYHWCKTYIEKNHMSNVILYGLVDNSKLIDMIRMSKALLLPTQWYEGFPMSIVEAYSVGTPVVGSNIGNVGEIIVEGKTGWKFHYNSVEDLVRAIRCEHDIVDYVKEEYENLYSDEKNFEQLKIIYDLCIHS